MSLKIEMASELWIHVVQLILAERADECTLRKPTTSVQTRELFRVVNVTGSPQWHFVEVRSTVQALAFN